MTKRIRVCSPGAFQFYELDNMAPETSLCKAFGLFVVLMTVVSSTKGACTFNKTWSGRWFQSGIQNLLYINNSYIETKGECYEQQADKYLVFDRQENCYKCLAMHEKQTGVLQYKESICETRGTLQEICNLMLGDAPLYTMFRKYPEVKPINCPFKSAPFTFSYSRGTGECSNPPSRAESCTDDSRLVLKYQACPDVESTESNIEELVCLATWKEGSTKYLIGKISQGNRRNLIKDEDQYRCFIYQKDKSNDKIVYSVAQSADATCSGVQSAFEGSRTMRLTTVDNHHNRCKFPKWITDHHTWLSLDHKKIYKFTQRNATLKILEEEPPAKPRRPPMHMNVAQPFAFQSDFGFESDDLKKTNTEMRVICHSILDNQEQKKVQIVAHITEGCDSGYVCMVFYKRDTNVIEIQQTSELVENPDEACSRFNPLITPFTTLITTNLHPKACPHLGRYVLPDKEAMSDIRKKRDQPDSVGIEQVPDCVTQDYEALTVGCTQQHQMEFHSSCGQSDEHAYLCHGSWNEDNVHYVITSPMSKKPSDTIRFCFIYTLGPSTQPLNDNMVGKPVSIPILRVSRVSDSCHRHVAPGSGRWSYNFTSDGACDGNDTTGSGMIEFPSFLLIVISATYALYLR